uniref:Uncharacterized protein n=1 Tax=Manihot esculenta TaxID=3983 RepID=A0A251KRM1_MANES
MLDGLFPVPSLFGLHLFPLLRYQLYFLSFSMTVIIWYIVRDDGWKYMERERERECNIRVSFFFSLSFVPITLLG